MAMVNGETHVLIKEVMQWIDSRLKEGQSDKTALFMQERLD